MCAWASVRAGRMFAALLACRFGALRGSVSGAQASAGASAGWMLDGMGASPRRLTLAVTITAAEQPLRATADTALPMTRVLSRGYASSRGSRIFNAKPKTHFPSPQGGAGVSQSVNSGSSSPVGSKRRGKNKANGDAPPLKVVMKGLVRKVHPDLFRSGPPGAAEVNDDSLKEIQGLLDAVTKSKSIPLSGIKRLKFYVHDDSAPEGVRVVPISFKTTGGDCRNMVATQLKLLFRQVGVPSEFRWEDGDWENNPDGASNASNRGDSAPAPAPATTPQPAPTSSEEIGGGEGGSGGGSTMSSTSESTSESTRSGGNQSETQPKNPNLMGALKVNDKLFEAIAAVPWIPEPGEDDRVRHIVHVVIPKLVEEGWNLDASDGRVEKIWKGERDESVLLVGTPAARQPR